MCSLRGVGVDIMLIRRMRECIGSREFVDTVFTKTEQDLATDRADEVRYYAKLFAGKEAVFKSLGLAGEELGSWREIEITDGEHGGPVVSLHRRCAQALKDQGAEEALVSLSYDGDYVLAACVLKGRREDVG